MKKLIIATVVLVMFAATVSAQETSFGVKGGLNLANISNMDNFLGYDGALKFKFMPAFYAGAFIEHKFSDLFAISPEFVYSMQGSKANRSEGGASLEVKVPVNYVNIPVLAKIYASEALSIDVGPQFGLLLSAKGKVKLTLPGEYSDEGFDEEIDLKEECNTFDIGIGIGATYNIGKFLIQGRYNLGFTDIIKFEGDSKPSDWKALKNNVLQVGVGVRF